MNRFMWVVVGLVVAVLVVVVGTLGLYMVKTREEIAGQYLFDTRPEGADVYIELDAQTVTHPWTYSADLIEVTLGQTVAIGLTNSDALPHDLVFGAPYPMRTRVLKKGETQWILFTATKETKGAQFWCTVPGHRQNGMYGTLVVKGG